MNFDLERTIEILEATPGTVRSMLGGLSDEWTASYGDRENWQPFDIVGHLICAEATDWIPRARIILENGDSKPFTPFDRFGQFENSKGKNLAQLLDEFDRARTENLATLRGWELTEDELDLPGSHPELGPVKLKELLATWAVHDLTHIRQLATVMARRYETAVGVWKEYLSILK